METLFFFTAFMGWFSVAIALFSLHYFRLDNATESYINIFSPKVFMRFNEFVPDEKFELVRRSFFGGVSVFFISVLGLVSLSLLS